MTGESVLPLCSNSDLRETPSSVESAAVVRLGAGAGIYRWCDVSG